VEEEPARPRRQNGNRPDTFPSFSRTFGPFFAVFFVFCPFFSLYALFYGFFSDFLRTQEHPF